MGLALAALGYNPHSLFLCQVLAVFVSNGGNIHDTIEWLEWQKQQFSLLLIHSNDSIECSKVFRMKLFHKMEHVSISRRYRLTTSSLGCFLISFFSFRR
jgi:hypothetical protein